VGVCDLGGWVQWARGAYLGPPSSVLIAVGIQDSTFLSLLCSGGSWRVLGTRQLLLSFVLAGGQFAGFC